ncbi:MAG TPA: hypothetical protein VKF35_04925 [Hyphomicrobiaceae bacterium]|nr:hypothetical protein [Hyphomicrobiaceae bacterium]
MPSLMIAFLLAFTLLAGFPFGVSLAQTPSQTRTEEIKKQDPVPPATDPKLSEQAGTTEPGAKVQATNPNQVFVNGVLAVPGASTDVDTAPAKHSARTDQDDQIPIAGYRLKKLDTQQLQQIAQELGSQRDAPTAASGGRYAVIGAEIPADTALKGLRLMPQALADQFTELRGTAFMRAGSKIVIVDPKNNVVIGVLGS